MKNKKKETKSNIQKQKIKQKEVRTIKKPSKKKINPISKYLKCGLAVNMGYWPQNDNKSMIFCCFITEKTNKKKTIKDLIF